MRMVAILTLFALTAGFGWIGAFPWLQRTPPAAPAAPSAALETPAPAPTPEADAKPTNLAPFVARPLFSAARRPPPPPEAPGVAIEAPRPDLLFGRYEIAGVVMLGDSALALLRDADGGLIRLRAGDSIATGPAGHETGEADIVKITLDSLTFRHDGATVAAPVRREGSKTE
ncbi:hypothetical protein G5B40_07265 [Pikeienuella piscinae]|uniref:Type II secretion system protein GspC N-terminal domain-containing protein n=1 Tax=Pikeienuella piscinae TaxID=2748098 RepID=A0A7L5BUH4_9RHOB|nr:hypothetical protein [Pikeienuella piscinae]QIE55272.1 hypothetical protein G5B40_07265 [Pikeienuella piscinae]